MFYWLGYYLTVFLGFLFFPRTVHGAKNIPAAVPRGTAAGGSFIFASNHLSALDPFIIGICCRYRIGYVAKESLFRNKILSYLLYKVEAFPIRRESTDIRALREALRRLKRGLPLVIFPQGTRTVSLSNQPQQGIGFIAVKSGVPVIPVFISGSDKVLGAEDRFFKRHAINVSFGEPVKVNKDDSYQAISSQIMQAINQLAPAKPD